MPDNPTTEHPETQQEGRWTPEQQERFEQYVRLAREGEWNEVGVPVKESACVWAEAHHQEVTRAEKAEARALSAEEGLRRAVAEVRGAIEESESWPTWSRPVAARLRHILAALSNHEGS